MEKPASDVPPQVAKLARRERQIATIVYTRGASTAKDVEACIDPPISNGALRIMLVRLVNKGILTRQWGKRGRAQQFVYLPAITPKDVKRRALKQLSELYFEGSLVAMMIEIFSGLEREDEVAHAREQILKSQRSPSDLPIAMNLAA